MPEPDLFVVTSQDCDILNSEDKEPALEVIGAYRLEKLTRLLMNGRNPRELHLSSETGERGKELLAFRVWKRGYVAKPDLVSTVPAGTISGAATGAVCAWLMGRYQRLTLPDAFVERFARAREDLERIVEDNSDVIADIWGRVRPDDQELADGEDYELDVVVVARLDVSVARDQRVMNRLRNEVRAQIKTAAHRCRGINLVSAEIKGPNDISFYDSQFFVPLGLVNG